jgi:hypothetical protein
VAKGYTLRVRSSARTRRQWFEVLRLQQAWDTRKGRKLPGAADRALAAALANYRNLLKLRLGPEYREVLNTPKAPPKGKQSGAPPPVVGQVRDY